MSIPAINQTGSHTVIKTPVVGVVVTGTPLDKFSLSLVKIIGEYLCDINPDDPKNIFKNLQLSMHSSNGKHQGRDYIFDCNTRSSPFEGRSSLSILTELAHDWRARSFLLTGQPNNDVIIDLFNRAFIHTTKWCGKGPIGAEKETRISAFEDLERHAAHGQTEAQKVKMELTKLGIIKPKETITIDLDPCLKATRGRIYQA
jgi:hypothetical protein